MDREAWSAADHRGHKESDSAEQMNWTELIVSIVTRAKSLSFFLSSISVVLTSNRTLTVPWSTYTIFSRFKAPELRTVDQSVLTDLKGIMFSFLNYGQENLRHILNYNKWLNYSGPTRNTGSILTQIQYMLDKLSSIWARQERWTQTEKGLMDPGEATGIY